MTRLTHRRAPRFQIQRQGSTSAISPLDAVRPNLARSTPPNAKSTLLARAGFASLAAALALLTLPSAAPAAPPWSRPVDVSRPGQDAIAPQVVVDKRGNALAVWLSGNGAGPNLSPRSIKAATRSPGGRWRAPKTLTPALRHVTTFDVAMDARGNATAVWGRSNGPDTIVEARTRPAGRGWQPGQTIASEYRIRDVTLAVNSRGGAAAAWSSESRSAYVVRAATRPAGGGWQTPQQLSDASLFHAIEPDVALNARGDATVVWTRPNGIIPIVQGAGRRAGGTWEAPRDLSPPGQNAIRPHVVLDGQGNAIAVWTGRGSSVAATSSVQATTRPANGNWQTPLQLSGPAGTRELAIDARGNTMAFWEGTMGIQTATRPAGGAWRSAETVSPVSTGNAQLALNARGDAIAIWSHGANPGNRTIRAATRKARGTWSRPRNLTAAGDNEAPHVAINPRRHAVAVWMHGTAGEYIAQAARLRRRLR